MAAASRSARRRRFPLPELCGVHPHRTARKSSPQAAPLRITFNSAESGLCGAPHNPEFGPTWLRCRLVKLEHPAEDGATHIVLWEPRDR
jgi:hypothetical protein